MSEQHEECPDCHALIGDAQGHKKWHERLTKETVALARNEVDQDRSHKATLAGMNE